MIPTTPLATHLVAHFDAVAEVYESWAVGLHAKLAERLAAWADPAAADLCLDVGTGTGLVARELAKRLGPDGRVIGIDPSAGMLREARRLGGPGIRFLEMWSEHLVFRDETFDLVTFGDSLSYLIDPFSSLDEAHRVLRPGGRIALSCHQRSLSTAAEEVSFAALSAQVLDDGLRVPRHTDYHNAFGEPEVLTRLLDEHGFRDVRLTQFMTGVRARGFEEWLDFLKGLGPYTGAVLSTMGPVRRATVGHEMERRMAELGDDAWRMHLSFTLAVASA
jgi:ubiquinone/menaquinone biosynthesis C-methylase UbiE